jgi:hypothetical protein
MSDDDIVIRAEGSVAPVLVPDPKMTDAVTDTALEEVPVVWHDDGLDDVPIEYLMIGDPAAAKREWEAIKRRELMITDLLENGMPGVLYPPPRPVHDADFVEQQHPRAPAGSHEDGSEPTAR